METIRSFIAIELPLEIHKGLEGVTQRLAAFRLPVRWVAAQNIHLTLKFFGDLSPAQVQAVIKILRLEARQHAPFTFQVEGLGVFPHLRRPRVVWVGVNAPPELGGLHRGIEAAFEKMGFEREERDFNPHLTLGRVGQNATLDDLRRLSEVVTKTIVGRLGEVRVEKVSLFRSELRPGGAVYSSLESSTLGQ